VKYLLFITTTFFILVLLIPCHSNANCFDLISQTYNSPGTPFGSATGIIGESSMFIEASLNSESVGEPANASAEITFHPLESSWIDLLISANVSELFWVETNFTVIFEDLDKCSGFIMTYPYIDSSDWWQFMSYTKNIRIKVDPTHDYLLRTEVYVEGYDYAHAEVTMNITPVSEPNSMLLFFLGLVVVEGYSRLRKNFQAKIKLL